VRVVVIGPGRMGSQIGVEYLLAGHAVAFVSRRKDAATTRIRDALGVAEASGLAASALCTDAEGRVEIVANVDDVDPSSDLVLESIAENHDAKVEVLRAAAAATPKALLASNTSSLSITALGEATGSPERTLGMHYLNPALLMRPVEVVVGAGTERVFVEQARTILTDLGKLPILVERDVPGFVWNRLQFALLREALWLVEQGVTTQDAVDNAMKEGLARRWRFTGPFESVAVGGPAVFATVAANLFPELSTAQSAENLERFASQDGATIEKLRKQRDRHLAAEARRDQGGRPRTARAGG
jgi:3-hydroxybutyryl-CoA dehydrogenase